MTIGEMLVHHKMSPFARKPGFEGLITKSKVQTSIKTFLISRYTLLKE